MNLLNFTLHKGHMKNSYPVINLDTYKNKILTAVENSIQIQGDWDSLVEVSQIYKALDSEQFYKEYSNALTTLLEEEFNAQAIGSIEIDDIFNPQRVRLTGGWKGLVGASKETILEELNKTIIEIKKLMKIAFQSDKELESFQKVINTKNGHRDEFFNNLLKFFQDTNRDSIQTQPVQEFIGACKSISEAYKDFIKPNSDKKKFLDSLSGNLKTVIGSGIWERILMIARAQAYEKGFDKQIFDDVLKSFQSSGGKITIKAKPRQTGAEKTNDGKSIVSDSLVDIYIQSDDNIVLTITVGDSSKYSQHHWYAINETVEQKQVSQSIGTFLNQLNVKDYWVEREGIFLNDDNSPATWDIDDIKNWNNTRAGIALLGMYDILAVRAGGNPVFSFSLNKKTATVYNFIKNYADTIASKETVSSIAGIPDFAPQWLKYVNAVYHMNENSEKQITRNTYLQNFMETKVHISINAFKGFSN